MSSHEQDTPAADLHARTQVQQLPEGTSSDDVNSTSPNFGTFMGPSVPGYPFLSQPQASGEIGRLGDYRVLAKLGEGGMGFVFRAEDPALKRFVALKVMRPEVAAKPLAADRFLREGRAAAGLKSDHIITIYQVGQANGAPFIAMEYLEGIALDEWMKQQKKAVPVPHVLRVVRDTLRGLATAHDKGLIHRDIKPANLWIEKGTARVKVLDFGLTRGTDGNDQMTADGAVVGTPAYMAPEQAAGKPVDPRADLFSVGTVMYQLFLGINPFVRSNMMATMGAVSFDVQPPVVSLRPEVPQAYSDYLDRLLAKDPAGRPANAKAALAELAAIEKSLQDTAKTLASSSNLPVVSMMAPAAAPVAAQIWGDITDADDTVVRTSMSDPETPRKPPSNKLLIGSGLFAFFALILGGIVIIITNKDGTKTKVEVPDGATVDVQKDGKTVASVGGKKAEVAKAPGELPPLPKFAYTPIPVGESPFDKLDPNAIPKEERFDGQPKELVGVIGTHARRHWGFVNWVTISPDGKLAASHAASGSDCVIVWDMATRQQKWTFSGGFPHAGSLTFTADSKRLICLNYGRLTTYDLAGDPAKPTSFDLSDKPEGRNDAWHYATLCEGGRTLAVHGWDDKIALFDLSTGTPRLGEVKQVANSGRTAVAGEASRVVYTAPDGKLRRATIKNAKFETDEELPIKLGEKEYPALSPDGKRQALWDTDHLQLWDLTQKPPKPVQTIKFPGIVSQDGRRWFSPDGRWLASKYTHTALIRIDGSEPKLAGWLDQTDIGSTGSVAFSHDGNRAVVGNSEGFVRFWDLSGAEPKELSPLEPAKAYPSPYYHQCPQIDPRSNRLMLRTYDLLKETNLTRHQLWDFAAAAPRQVPGPESPLDANGGMLFPLQAERWLQIPMVHGNQPQRYEVRDNRWQPLGEPFGEPDTLGTVSGDGKWMIQLSGTKPGEMKLHGWDVSGDPVKKWSVPVAAKAEWVHGWWILTSSWQGTSFAVTLAVGADRELALYRNTGAKAELTGTIPIKPGAGQYRAAISPDGRTLAHLRDNSWGDIVLEDISSGKAKELNRTGEQSGLGPILWLAFSPDGRHLAYASHIGVSVLDAKTLKPVYEWKTAAGPVNWVDWAADGRHLVTHNGNKTVYVLRLPDLSFAADRKAAEFVIGKGGTVSVHTPEKYVFIRHVKDLPNEPFKLNNIEFPADSAGGMTDADLDQFRDLDFLNWLDLRGPNSYTNAGLAKLAGFPIAGKLSRLFIASDELTDDAFQAAAKFPTLHHFALRSKRVTGSGIAHLKTSSISMLTLGNCGLVDAEMVHLKAMPNLQQLGIFNTSIGDVGLKHISEVKQLNSLQIQNCGNLTDEGMKHLEKCEALQYIELNSPLTGACFQSLGKIKTLTRIHSSGIKVTDADVKHLMSLPKFEELGLHLNLITDVGLETLSQIKTLNGVNVKGSKVTAAGVKKFRAALPECKVTSDFPE